MKAYTINLKRCSERRAYVNSEINKTPFIKNEFVDGVDGSTLSTEELSLFQSNISQKTYGRTLKLGEIGCTMSHRKCYKTLIDNNESSVIIFEDDLIILNKEQTIWNSIESFLDRCEQPTVVLLSGGWWEYGSAKLTDTLNLRKIHNAYYTHGYMLNKAAAKLMLTIPLAYLADDWKRYKKFGLKVLAIKPHIVDQKWDGSMPSIIQNDPKHGFNSLNWKYKLKSYINIIPCKILGLLGLHESDNINNQKQI